MKSDMHDIDSVAKMIAEGKCMLLAGDPSLLAKLPKGNWIGGSCVYFMTERGGLHSDENIMVSSIPDCAGAVSIKYYDKHSVANVYADMYSNGYSLMALPAFCATHAEFALNAPAYKNFAAQPLAGYITGVGLDELGRKQPCIVDGLTGTVYEDGAMVMHVCLPSHKAAQLDTLNMFEPGAGDKIEFLSDGFWVRDALINGQRQNFADYLLRNKVDLQFPLVADFDGVKINTSFQSVDEASKTVQFYAPVFKDAEYHLAAQPGDYVERFVAQMSVHAGSDIVFSCNCILNYLYAGLEGRKIGEITGPVTFGEVAYQLLNQTMVYLRIVNV